MTFSAKKRAQAREEIRDAAICLARAALLLNNHGDPSGAASARHYADHLTDLADALEIEDRAFQGGTGG